MLGLGNLSTLRFHILGGLIVHKHTYVNAFRTKQRAYNIVDGRFSGVYVRWDSTSRPNQCVYIHAEFLYLFAHAAATITHLAYNIKL